MGVQRDVIPLAGGEAEGDSAPLRSSPDSKAYPDGCPVSPALACPTFFLI